MRYITLNCAGITTRGELHAALADALHFPDWYGNNLDALHDLLTQIHTDTRLVLLHFEQLDDFRKAFQRVLTDSAAENPHLQVSFPILPADSIAISALSATSTLRRKHRISGDTNQLTERLKAFVRDHGKEPGVGNLLVNTGEEYMEYGDRAAAFAFLSAAEGCEETGNLTLLYLRMAQFAIESGDTETGIGYLTRLCTETVSNYEESIAFNGLTPVWESYRHLVDGKVPPSVPFCTGPAPMPPEQCSCQIGDILALPEEDLLSALSEHLGELSAGGTQTNCLNKWEKTVFYADELCMEVNSGGFEGYLYSCGLHFEKAAQGFTAMGAAEMLALMGAVREKFPKGKIPKSESALHSRLDAMTDDGIDFEAEDARYYESAEKELLQKLLRYVTENKAHFR